MKKRFLTMMIATFMVVSLVGCGGKEENPAFNQQGGNTSVTDPVEDEQAGHSGPADEPTAPKLEEESQKDPATETFTLLSEDGSKELKTFEVPEGYEVVSDTKGSKIELIDKNNEFIKIEIFSGVNSEVLGAWSYYGLKYGRCLAKNGVILETPEEIAIELGGDINVINNPLYKWSAAYEVKGVQSGYYIGACLDHHIHDVTNQATGAQIKALWCACHGILKENSDPFTSTSYEDISYQLINDANYDISNFGYQIYDYYSHDGQNTKPVDETWTVRITVQDEYFETGKFEGNYVNMNTPHIYAEFINDIASQF